MRGVRGRRSGKESGCNGNRNSKGNTDYAACSESRGARGDRERAAPVRGNDGIIQLLGSGSGVGIDSEIWIRWEIGISGDVRVSQADGLDFEIDLVGAGFDIDCLSRCGIPIGGNEFVPLCVLRGNHDEVLADHRTADAGPVVDLKISVSIADGHGSGQVLAAGEFFCDSGVELNTSIANGVAVDLDRAIDPSERGKLEVIPHEIV